MKNATAWVMFYDVVVIATTGILFYFTHSPWCLIMLLALASIREVQQ